MTTIKMLFNLAELRNSGYGQPSPRHGLNLLYWFSTTCVTVNCFNDMISLCSPRSGDFGFRTFHNRDDKGKGRLLPDSNNLPYYELGNLSASGVKSLPEYVRERYTGFQDKSNTDRIIVCYHSGFFTSVYVTRHENQASFNRKHTYRIHPELLRTIEKLQREDFLREAKRQRRHLTLRSLTPVTLHQYDLSQGTSSFSSPSFQSSGNHCQKLHQETRSLPASSYKPSSSCEKFCAFLLMIITCLVLLVLFCWNYNAISSN